MIFNCCNCCISLTLHCQHWQKRCIGHSVIRVWDHETQWYFYWYAGMFSLFYLVLEILKIAKLRCGIRDPYSTHCIYLMNYINFNIWKTAFFCPLNWMFRLYSDIRINTTNTCKCNMLMVFMIFLSTLLAEPWCTSTIILLFLPSVVETGGYFF